MKLFFKKLFRRPKPCGISIGIDPICEEKGVLRDTIIYYCREHEYVFMTPEEGCVYPCSSRYRFKESK